MLNTIRLCRLSIQSPHFSSIFLFFLVSSDFEVAAKLYRFVDGNGSYSNYWLKEFWRRGKSVDFIIGDCHLNWFHFFLRDFDWIDGSQKSWKLNGFVMLELWVLRKKPLVYPDALLGFHSRRDVRTVRCRPRTPSYFEVLFVFRIALPEV